MIYANVRRISLVLIGVALLAALVLIIRFESTQAQLRSLSDVLWQNYKTTIWDHTTGRTIDAQDADVTTSEAQAYTMLRAVWQNDPSTFASAWQWTQKNLQRPDKLFSWRWGQRPDGSWGILTGEGGENTASDADTDMAFSLLMAGGRWHQPAYLTAARSIIPEIWNVEVITVRGVPYVAADNIERTAHSSVFVVNPSYLSPYAYRSFAAVDPAHPWQQLVTSSYALLQKASAAPLGSPQSDGLPPNWLAVNRRDGSLTVAGNDHDTDFGYDAFRALWRVALDFHWNRTVAAKQTLDGFTFLADQWDSKHQLLAIYHHDGTAAANYTSLALYGGTLGYFQIEQPSAATAIVQNQLLPLLGPKQQLVHPLDYYDNNWVWFGLMLYTGSLPNYAKGAMA